MTTPVNGKSLFWVDENGKALDPQPSIKDIKALGLTPGVEDYERELATLKTNLDIGFTRDELYALLTELVVRIEQCGGSPELTYAVSLACDLSGAIGNKWNKPFPHSKITLSALLDTLQLS